jgi:hypothetical protein
MPKFRIEGEIYDAASPEEAYKKHDQAMAQRVEYNRGANMPTAARAGLTAAQGATFNFADELAGALAMQGAAEAQRGAGMAGIRASSVDPMSLYDPAKQRVLGATESFAKERPGAALTAEILGAASTIPLTMGASAVPATAGMIRRGAQFFRPIVGQSALGAVGSTEVEAPEDFSAEVAKKTAEGTFYGGALGAGGKILGAVGRQIGPRLPGVGEKLATTPARERLAQLLERDAEARIISGGDPITIAESRLRKFGPDAPLAVTGRETTEELGLLRNLPGAQQRMIEAETRRIQKQRGGALERGAEEAMDAQGVPFRATVLQYSQDAQAKAAPFYQQLEGQEFVVDKGLADLLTRSRRAFGEAEELAAVRGMPAKLDLGTLRPGDRVPFEVLDNLKRTLYDIEEAAKGEFGKSTEKSRAYTQLRRSLIAKLDELSPKDAKGQSIYRQARQAFEGEAQLESAMRRGRDALKEDAEELAATMADLEPSQLEAFRMGALQGIRDLAGTGAGQTRLLNVYKEPTLQAKLRTIFGNDFRKFQKAILQQEEIRRVERAGQGSQTFKLGARSEDQGAMMDALDVAQSAQAGGVPFVERVSRKFSQLRMPEQSRKELARLLLLRGEPAANELTNMRAFMERRRRQQALAGQLSGRTGAITSQE